MTEYTFCSSCGSLKESNKICLACTNIIRTKQKSDRIAKELESFSKSRQIKEKFYQKKKKAKQQKKKTYSIKYSDALGLEWHFETNEEESRKKVNYCVKCKQNRLHYAGWWVKAGGRYASSETNKRIFICSQCWKPKKEYDD